MTGPSTWGAHTPQVWQVPPFVVRDTHRDLLAALEPPGNVLPAAAGDGLVVVPATRGPGSALATPVAIAGALGWPLLVLCSRGLRPTDVRTQVRLTAHHEVRLVAAAVTPADGLRARRPWECPDHPEARRRADIDTNRKRNLGLAAAVMTDLDWVLFVDDDVFGLDPRDVLTAVGHLRRHPEHTVVGWPAVAFPDNSVVHHARRDYLGRPQTCFVGGGALLARIGGSRPSGFPPVYNEDWLFLYDALDDGAAVLGRDVRQLEKDVYGDSRRAALEEFGDVLAEGLFHLLHVGAPVEAATEPGYWQAVRAKRERLHARITERLRELHAEDARDHRVVAALAALAGSRAELTRATGESLADFVRRWRYDLETWDEFMTALPPRDTLVRALTHLGVHESWIVTA